MKLSRTRNLLACLLVALAAGCAILTEPGPEAQNAAQRINSEIKEYRNGAPPPAVRSDATGYVRGGNLFAQVYEQVQLHYVRAVDEETLVAAASKEMRKRYPDPSKVKDKDLVEAAVYGMLGSLDSYSTYLDEEHWRSLREQTRGRFGGLGIRILWAVLGLLPAVLFVTGFVLWWTRVVRRRTALRAADVVPANQ